MSDEPDPGSAPEGPPEPPLAPPPRPDPRLIAYIEERGDAPTSPPTENDG